MDELRWVCLDIGETLVDETRVWTNWARLLAVTPLVLMGAIGIEIAAGRSYDGALARFTDDVEGLLPAAEDTYGTFRAADLYPDAVDVVDRLHQLDLQVAVIGNQPARRTAELRVLGVAPDVMVMSDELGVAKPDPAFFAAALAAMGDPDPGVVTYVGDRLDNDVVAATGAGLRAIHLRRGPWGILGPQDTTGLAAAVVDDLAGVVRAVAPG